MLIKDLINIPERIYANEFVIKLTEGIERPEETLDQYVVTAQLKRQYEKALSLVQNSLVQGKSQAAFLHGSFGSGKSHFMAVLNLLLKGNPKAWGHPDLASVTLNFSALRERKLLLLAFHMIGASSMESAILGGYARTIAEQHPGAPVPAFYRGEKLFEDARNLMGKMGEEAFFAQLAAQAPAAKTALGRRGGATVAWDRSRFEEAAGAAPGNPQRQQLVSALLSSYFTGYSDVQRDNQESYLPFDQALEVLSQHAKSLGYDGIVLFLDELILWLANMSSNLHFVHGEIQKLVKLVEAEHSDRPAPIISIVARQRDLKDLIGESLSGFEQFNFHDQIKHFEKRFDTINLEDTNLPEIIERRILKPKSEAARTQLHDQFDRLKLNPNIRDILAHNYDLDSCRRVYPFSPALIDTLVAVSSLLQRNRTAIRILMELLVEQQESLSVGQLIPVGDLFDLVSGNYEPYDDSVRRGFESAKRILQERFAPMLEDSEGNPVATQATDLRLIKTILLAALVPEVPALRKLTPQKLAALNHGTLKSPIAGRESALVLTKLKNWQTNIGELRVDPDSEEISLNLTTVDLEKILEGARTQDNAGQRKGYLRRLLFQMLKIDQDAQANMTVTYDLVWRGTKRSFEVQYLNIREKSNLRELQADQFPKLILDYPFDDEGCHPSDDLVKLEAYRSQHPETRTLIWLPFFLSKRTLTELGRLIMIEYILTGDRLTAFLSHLAPTDRPSAKALLENQRSALQERMRQALEMAYGILRAEPGILDESDQKQLPADKQLQSLHAAFQPRMPAVSNLEQALREILAKELEAHFPGHPAFPVDKEISLDAVRKVWKEVKETCKTDDQRLEITDKTMRDRLREVAQPLLLGKMGETHFLLNDHWRNKFEQEMARHQISGPVRVERLQEWMDQPRPIGLPARLKALIIYTFAEQTQRQLVRQGLVLRDFEADLAADVELCPMELPTDEVWSRAWERARLLLPDLYPLNCTTANVELLSQRVGEAIQPRRQALLDLPAKLRQLCQATQVDPAQSPRLNHSRLAADLVNLLETKDARERVEQLARARWSDVPEELAAFVRGAPAMLSSLSQENLEMLAELPQLPSGEDLLHEMQEAMQRSEQAQPLGPVVELGRKQVFNLIRSRPQTPPSVAPAPARAKRLKAGQLKSASQAEAKAELRKILELLEDPKVRLSLNYEVWQEP
jgi:hypothetical protein